MSVLRIDLSSRQARDATRLAIQSAIAAAAMFSVMQALGLPEKFVGIISAVLVVQPSTGGTMGEAWDRMLATIVGSVIGVVCLALLPGGYGTAGALAISMLVMNAVAGFREEWRYGVVAAVALALGSENEAMQTALDRSIAIGLGVVIGGVTALIVWPDSASRRAKRHLQEALSACADYLELAIDRVTGESGDAKAIARRYRSNLASARDAADAVRFGDADHLHERIDATDRLWSAARWLYSVGEEDAPAKEGQLGEIAKRIRQEAGKAARSLAQNEAPSEECIADIERALEDGRERIGGEDTGNFRRTSRAALVFTLGEAADALRDHRDLLVSQDDHHSR